MGSLAREDFDDDNADLSPFQILHKAVHTIVEDIDIKQQAKQENSVSPKKRICSFNFDFLKDMSSCSSFNTNTLSSTSREGKALLITRRKDAKWEGTSSRVGSENHVDDDQVVLTDEEEAKPGSQQQQPLLPKIKKRSHCHIEQIPNLLEECSPPHPKKPRSPSPNTDSITLFGQKIITTTNPASASESDHIHQAQMMVMNNATLKRKYSEDDKDWAAASNKKQKVKFWFNGKNLKTKRMVNGGNKIKSANHEQTTPDLPDEFKQLIQGEMNGTMLQLLAQKTLYNADVRKDQGRLSLPREQASTKKFLKRNERRRLEEYKSLPVPLIDPMLVQSEIPLGWWKMSSKPLNTYVLKSSWNNIVEDHHLEIGDVVQVWSFRAANPKYISNNDPVPKVDENDDSQYDVDHDGELHLALVIVKRGDPIPKDEGGNGSATTSCEDRASCSPSHKQEKVVDGIGSSSGSCSPEKYGSSSTKQIVNINQDQGTFK